jgi:hypothetical protein
MNFQILGENPIPTLPSGPFGMKIAISTTDWGYSEWDRECKRRNHRGDDVTAGCVGGGQSVCRPIQMCGVLIPASSNTFMQFNSTTRKEEKLTIPATGLRAFLEKRQ